MGAMCWMPAFDTITSTEPNSRTQAATPASTCCSSVTSIVTASPEISRAAASAPRALTSAMQTFAPSFVNARAMARPSPLAAPVTSAAFPWSFMADRTLAPCSPCGNPVLVRGGRCPRSEGSRAILSRVPRPRRRRSIGRRGRDPRHPRAQRSRKDDAVQLSFGRPAAERRNRGAVRRTDHRTSAESNRPQGPFALVPDLQRLREPHRARERGCRPAGADAPSAPLLGEPGRAAGVRAAGARDPPPGPSRREGAGPRRGPFPRPEAQPGNRDLAHPGSPRPPSRRAHERHGPRGRRAHRPARQGSGEGPDRGLRRAQHGSRRPARPPHHRARPRPGPRPRHVRGGPQRRPGRRGLPRGGTLTAPLLEVKDLEAWYGEAQALHGVSLRVERGECVALLGRNGAGKTTTLRSIMGVLRKKRGEIVFEGQDITRLSSHQIARRGISWVPEERAIFATLTVQENLVLPPAWRNGWSVARCQEAFPALKSRGEHSGAKLSGGEQQMLAIARVLRAGPTLLLLDEPSEGLAPVVVQQIGRILRELKQKGQSMLLVESNLHFALSLADRHVLIVDGEVKETLTGDEVRARDKELVDYLSV